MLDWEGVVLESNVIVIGWKRGVGEEEDYMTCEGYERFLCDFLRITKYENLR